MPPFDKSTYEQWEIQGNNQSIMGKEWKPAKTSDLIYFLGLDQVAEAASLQKIFK